MKYFTFFRCLSLLMLFCIGFFYVFISTANANFYDVEDIHEPNYFRLNSNASYVDSVGVPHVFYGAVDLIHAYRDSNTGSWIKEVIDNSAAVGRDATITVDNSGVVHIIYRDNYEGFLKYAKGNTGQWEIEQAETNNPSDSLKAGIGSLEIDSNGVLHHAYMNFNNETSILYGTYSSGIWNYETALQSAITTTGGGEHLNEISIGLDSQLGPHIVLKSGNALKHIFKINGNWQTEDIATTGPNGRLKYNAIAFDQQNVLHVCYDDFGTNNFNRSIYCANKSSGAWVSELVHDWAAFELEVGQQFNNAQVGVGLALKIDNNSNLHLSYYGVAGNQGYTIYATNSSGNWNIENQPITLHSPSPSSLENTSSTNLLLLQNGGIGLIHLDHNQSSQIAQTVNEDRELTYSFFNGTNWLQEVIDTSIHVHYPIGLYTSHAIDSSGNPSVSYTTSEGKIPSTSQGGVGDIEFSYRNNNNEWIYEKPVPVIPQNAINSNAFRSIWHEHDSLGQPHLIHADVGGFSHTRNDAGTWLKELVTNNILQQYPPQNYREGLSAVMDEQDAIHIATMSCLSSTQELVVIYTTNQNGSWESEVAYDYELQNLQTNFFSSLCSSTSQRYRTSINIDNSGDVLITFFYKPSISGVDANLRQIKKENGQWNVRLNEYILVDQSLENIALEVGISDDLDLELLTEKNGTIHAVYNLLVGTLNVPAGLRYSKYENGSWSHRQLVRELYANNAVHPFAQPRFPSIALDENGNAYISYLHDSFDDVRIIDTKNQLNRSIVIDTSFFRGTSTNPYKLHNDTVYNNGKVYTSYFHATDKGVKLATNDLNLNSEITTLPLNGWSNVGGGLLSKQIIISNTGNDSFYVNEAFFYKVIDIGQPVFLGPSPLEPFSISQDTCTSLLLTPSGSCSYTITINQSDVNSNYVDVMLLSLLNSSQTREQVMSVEFSSDLFNELTTPAPSQPEILSPLTGTVLTSASQTFSWDAMGTPVTEWWINLGSTLGGRDIHVSGSLGTATSTTISNIPVDGSTVYARLWYRNGSAAWQSNDFSYTAFTGPAPSLPTITSPTDGSTFTSATQTFSWDAMGTPVTEWWINLGSTLGGRDIHVSGSLGTATSTTISNIPVDGSTVYARLWYRNGSAAWQSNDFSYTAFTGPAPSLPTITSPTDGSTFTSATQTFSWDAMGTPVTEWWINLGSTLGGRDIHVSGSLGTATSTTISNIPVDGSTVYARLWYRNGSAAWQSNDFSYTAFTGPAPSLPTITSPTDGSTFTSATQTFSWDAMGTPVTEWWINLGSTLGGRDIHVSGSLGTATSTTISNIPVDGSTVYARLWYRNGSAAWQSNDFSYTAFTGPAPSLPTITSPTDGSTFTSATQTFSWDAMGTPVTEWWINLGSTLGGRDIHVSGSLGTATSTTISNIPVDGSTVYARLWYRNGSAAWQSNDFSYTAFN